MKQAEETWRALVLLTTLQRFERMEELRRERGQWTRDQSAEATDADRQPMNRRAVPLAKPELGPFRRHGPLG
jgi:hypothetical protein